MACKRDRRGINIRRGYKMRSIMILVLMLACFLAGCVIPGQNAYLNDPFTGGVDATRSKLLNIPLPSGLQYYPSHSHITGGGRKDGLEIWRGYIDEEAAASHIYATLKQAGWQIRMMEKAGSRSAYIYQHEKELCAIIFQKQGVLTIVQIWAGPRLEHGTSLGMSGASKENGAAQDPSPGPDGLNISPDSEKGGVETWEVEEREL